MASRRLSEDTPARLELAPPDPQTVTERELLQMFRDSIANDRITLFSLLMVWPSLSPAHRGMPPSRKLAKQTDWFEWLRRENKLTRSSRIRRMRD